MKRCPKCFGTILRMGHIEKPFYCPECKEWFSNEEVTPKSTNADRIRKMTDEELAQVLRNPCDITGHIPTEWCKGRNCGYKCALDWLKQEIE